MKAFTTLLTGLTALVGSVAALPINGNGTAGTLSQALPKLFLL